MCAAIPTRGCQCPCITVLTWPGLSNQNAAAQGSRGRRVEEVTGHSRCRLAVKENSHLARAWSCLLISNASQAGPCQQHQHLSVQADRVLSYRGNSKVTLAETRVLLWLHLTCPHLGCVYDGRAVSLQMSMSVQPQEPTVSVGLNSTAVPSAPGLCLPELCVPANAQTMRVVKTTRLHGNLQTEAAGTGRKDRAPHTGLFQESGCVL